MEHAPTPVPARIVTDLLAVHPEAQSLLGEAGHREILARHSAAAERQAFREAQAGRLRFEELRHLLDPRRQRGLHYAAGLLLAALGAGLAGLADTELSNVIGEPLAARWSVGLAAAWLIGAWLAALAAREGRRWFVVLLGGGGAALALLLALVHDLAGATARSERTHAAWIPLAVGCLAGVLILVLAMGAAALIGRLEPASVFQARRRWQRLSAEHEVAARRAAEDAELASVAREAWLRLLRQHITASADADRVHVADVMTHLESAPHATGR